LRLVYDVKGWLFLCLGSYAFGLFTVLRLQSNFVEAESWGWFCYDHVNGGSCYDQLIVVAAGYFVLGLVCLVGVLCLFVVRLVYMRD